MSAQAPDILRVDLVRSKQNFAQTSLSQITPHGTEDKARRSQTGELHCLHRSSRLAPPIPPLPYGYHVFIALFAFQLIGAKLCRITLTVAECRLGDVTSRKARWFAPTGRLLQTQFSGNLRGYADPVRGVMKSFSFFTLAPCAHCIDRTQRPTPVATNVEITQCQLSVFLGKYCGTPQN